MELETIYWSRQRENHAMLREALLLLRSIAATTPPTPTSPPSSKNPTATPSTIRPSLLERMAEKIGYPVFHVDLP